MGGLSQAFVGYEQGVNPSKQSVLATHMIVACGVDSIDWSMYHNAKLANPVIRFILKCEHKAAPYSCSTFDTLCLFSRK